MKFLYKNMYIPKEGALVPFTENKICYTDSAGIKRTVTNPEKKDLLRAGYKPKKYKSNSPAKLDGQNMIICDKGDFWEISFEAESAL